MSGILYASHNSFEIKLHVDPDVEFVLVELSPNGLASRVFKKKLPFKFCGVA